MRATTDAAEPCSACGASWVALDDRGSEACPRCCHEQIVLDDRPDPLRDFVFQNAVLLGGARTIGRDGEQRLMRAEPPLVPSLVWAGCALLAASALLLAAAILFDLGAFAWIGSVSLVGLVLVTFVLTALVWRRRWRELVVDETSGECTIVDRRARIVLCARIDAIGAARVVVVAPPSYGDRYEVVLSFDRARVRVAQLHARPDAEALAAVLARCAGVPLDAEVRRVSPHG